jgi:hypothetical protein
MPAVAVARTVTGIRSVTDLRAVAADLVGWTGGFALVVGTARSGGGYFPVEYLTLGIAALVLGAVVLLLRPAPSGPSRRAVVALLALAGYAGWLGASAAWSPAPSTATADFQRNLSYAAVLALGVIVVGSGRGARGLAHAVWVALTGNAVAGVLSRLLPGLELTPQIDPAFQFYRLSWPVTYWNAQGTVAAMAVVLGLGIACDRRSGAVLRAVAAATTPLLLLGLLFTVSRGSVASLVVGVVALIALSRRPLQALAVTAACAGPSAIAVALAVSEPSIVDDPTALPALADTGPRLLLEAAALSVLAGALAAGAFAVLRGVEHRRRERRQHRTPRRQHPAWVPTAAVAGGVLALLVLLLAAGRIDDSVSGETTSLRGFIDEQRTTFLDPQSQSAAGIERLGSVGGSRSDLYRVALDQFDGAPGIGAGGGAFAGRWLRDRETAQPVQNAHSLPLETLAETGLVGAALLSALLGAALWGATLARRRAGALPRSMAAGVSAAIATFFASCAIDWTWQMGTLTAATLLLAATLLTDGRSATGRAGPPRRSSRSGGVRSASGGPRRRGRTQRRLQW